MIHIQQQQEQQYIQSLITNNSNMIIQPFKKKFKIQNYEVKLNEFKNEIKLIFTIRSITTHAHGIHGSIGGIHGSIGGSGIGSGTTHSIHMSTTHTDTTHTDTTQTGITHTGTTINSNDTNGSSKINTMPITINSSKKLINCQLLFRKCKEICLLNGRNELKKWIIDKTCNEYLKKVVIELNTMNSTHVNMNSTSMNMNSTSMNMNGTHMDTMGSTTNSSLMSISSAMNHLIFQWNCFKDILSTLSHILLYLDKTYLLSKGEII